MRGDFFYIFHSIYYEKQFKKLSYAVICCGAYFVGFCQLQKR